MASKGIDSTFVHFGIRGDDLKIIESTASDHGIDVDWLKDLLQGFHDKKIKHSEMDDKEVRNLIEENLNKVEL